MTDLEFEAYRLAAVETYTGSLFASAKHLLGFKEMTKQTHGPMCSLLERPDIYRKLLTVPRGTFKSSVGAVSYPIWRLIKNPNLRILIDSELFGNSVTYLNEIKNKVMTPHFKAIFGDWMPTNEQQKRLGYSWSDSEITIRTRNQIKKEPSISVGGVGTTKVGQHYDLIIGDDYNSPKNSATKEQRDKVIDHFKYNQSILDPGGEYVIIGTRYSEDDLIGWILKNELNLTLDELYKQNKQNGIYTLEPKGLLGDQ